MKHTDSRIDLHVHTRFSTSAGDWLLQNLGANESYTHPRDVYRIAKARGMDFVTISDHDTINGALEIAHLDDFFISEEVTTYFPHDKAKIHVVCLDIDEAIHRDIQLARDNIYELVAYLDAKQITHFVAHPFFRMGKVLSFEHFEKLLLLFRGIEVKNGGKQLLPEKLLIKIIKSLTPQRFLHLANKHDLQPVGETPWNKFMVAGSDDHGGITISCPHTVCPPAKNPRELIDHIRNGRTSINGHGGSMMSVAHQIMAVSYKYARENKKSLPIIQSQLTWKLMDNIFQDATRHSLTSMAAGFYFDFMSSPENSSTKTESIDLMETLKSSVKDDPYMQSFIKGDRSFNHKNNKAFLKSMDRIFCNAIRSMVATGSGQSGILQKLALFKSATGLLPILAPYAIAARTEYQDRHLMRQAANSFIQNGKYYRGRIAVFCETLTLQTLNQSLPTRMLGNETISRKPYYIGFSEKPFKKSFGAGYAPIASIQVDNKAGNRIQIASILQLMYDMVSKDFELIYIKSLDSMAVWGTLLGRLLNIPVVARFPARPVARWLDSIQDRNQAKIVRYLLKIFYSQMAEIQINTYYAKKVLLSLHVAHEKIRLHPKKQSQTPTPIHISVEQYRN